jgi:hypothetical protein
MGNKKVFLFGALLAAALLVISCDDFISGSMGTQRNYDSSKIDLNAGNVDDWIEKAVGNPELASALTDNIKTQLKETNLNNNERAKLQEAGVTLAVEASGIGANILSNGSGAVSKIEQKGVDGVVELFKDVQGDFKSNNGLKAAKDISEIVGGSITMTDGIPEITGQYAENAKPSDVSQAVLVLTLAVLEQEHLDANAENLKVDQLPGLIIDGNGMVKKDPAFGGEPSQEALTLAAYLNLINKDPGGKFGSDTVTSRVTDALKK